jgi:hypothetical protein
LFLRASRSAPSAATFLVIQVPPSCPRAGTAC